MPRSLSRRRSCHSSSSGDFLSNGVPGLNLVSATDLGGEEDTAGVDGPARIRPWLGKPLGQNQRAIRYTGVQPNSSNISITGLEANEICEGEVSTASTRTQVSAPADSRKQVRTDSVAERIQRLERGRARKWERKRRMHDQGG